MLLVACQPASQPADQPEPCEMAALSPRFASLRRCLRSNKQAAAAAAAAAATKHNKCNTAHLFHTKVPQTSCLKVSSLFVYLELEAD